VSLLVLLVAAAFGCAQIALGIYRLTAAEPGLTGIRSARLRFAAWMLTGTDVRRDGSLSRVSLGDGIAGTLHLVLGLAVLAIVGLGR
jgi:hypothetical protein